MLNKILQFFKKEKELTLDEIQESINFQLGGMEIEKNKQIDSDTIKIRKDVNYEIPETKKEEEIKEDNEKKKINENNEDLKVEIQSNQNIGNDIEDDFVINEENEENEEKIEEIKEIEKKVENEKLEVEETITPQDNNEEKSEKIINKNKLDSKTNQLKNDEKKKPLNKGLFISLILLIILGLLGFFFKIQIIDIYKNIISQKETTIQKVDNKKLINLEETQVINKTKIKENNNIKINKNNIQNGGIKININEYIQKTNNGLLTLFTMLSNKNDSIFKDLQFNFIDTITNVKFENNIVYVSFENGESLDNFNNYVTKLNYDINISKVNEHLIKIIFN